MNIKVAIADDHPMITKGVGLIFNNYPNITLTQIYKSGKELLDGLAFNNPDVLILDIQLPDKSGDELLPLVLAIQPNLKILVLTSLDSPLYATKMLWQGAKGFLLKTAEESILVEAIEVINNGGEYIEKELKGKIEQNTLRSKKLFTSKSTLTEREKEILQLIVEGYTNPEIASKVFLGLDTIKHYRKSLLLKLDVKNTAALVSKALKQGLAR